MFNWLSYRNLNILGLKSKSHYVLGILVSRKNIIIILIIIMVRVNYKCKDYIVTQPAAAVCRYLLYQL